MYGFRAKNDYGSVQIDGETEALNLVYSAIVQATVYGNPFVPVTEEHASRVEIFVPPHYLEGEFAVAVRGIDTHCVVPSRAKPGRNGPLTPLRLEATFNPVGQPATPATRSMEVYIFKPTVSVGGVAGLRIRKAGKGVVFNSNDTPMWMATGQIPARSSVAVPAGVTKAAVLSWYAPALGGGAAGEGGYFIAQPIAFREINGFVQPDRPGSPNLSQGSYSIVDVSNCPIPFGS